MSAAHTPGPWIYGEANNAVITPRGHLIASLDDRHPDDEAATGADAKLIAAAPQLAEALRMALEVHAYAPGRGPAWYQAARAALTVAGVTP